MSTTKMTAETSPALEMLAKQFEDWVDNRRGISPLYDAIVRSLIKDRDLLALIAEAGDRPLVYNVFMGAIHYLLLERPDNKLAQIYSASISDEIVSSDAYPEFRKFCFENKDEILRLARQREIQINEVRRCAVLVPALEAISRLVFSSPLALLDVGACAGLNLNFDRYRYDYGAAGAVGPIDSAVKIDCTIRGTNVGAIPTTFPSVPWRLGIDCEPVDVNNPHATNWLIALVSPDDGTRLNLLRAALGIAKQKPPEVLEGKACDLLADALASIPQGLVPCIFHSFTTHHFEDDEMTEFGAIQAEYGQRRELYSISFEWERQDGQIQMRKPVPLKLTTFGKGSPRERIFGLADNRGGCEAIEWLAPA